MAKYRRDNDQTKNSMPIYMQVALGILLAGAVGALGKVIIFGFMVDTLNTSFAKIQEKVMLSRLNRNTPYPNETVNAKTIEITANRAEELQQPTPRLNSTESIRDQSGQAYYEAVPSVNSRTQRGVQGLPFRYGEALRPRLTN
jgi:hypothetical protein